MLPERALLCSLKSLIKLNKKIRTEEQDYLDGKEAGKALLQVSSLACSADDWYFLRLLLLLLCRWLLGTRNGNFCRLGCLELGRERRELQLHVFDNNGGEGHGRSDLSLGLNSKN